MDKDRSVSWNSTTDDEPEEEKPRNPMFDTRVDFFKNFIAERSAPKPVEVDDDEEDDEELDENGVPISKKNRFTRSLKTVFPRIANSDRQVQKPEVRSPVFEVAEVTADESAAEVPHRPEAPELHPLDRVESVADIIASRPYTEQADKQRVEEGVDANQEPLITEIPEDLYIEIDHPASEVPEKVTVENEDATKFEEVAQDEPLADQYRDTQKINDAEYNQSIQTSSVIERAGGSAVPNIQPKNQEKVIIERQRSGGAVLAFLGAEFLSRRRDRKLAVKVKQEAKTRSQSLEELKKHQTAQQEKLESSISGQGQKIENLGRRLDHQENIIPQPENKSVPASEVPPPLFYQSAPRETAPVYNHMPNNQAENPISAFSVGGEARATPTSQEVDAYKESIFATEYIDHRYPKSERSKQGPELKVSKSNEKNDARRASQYETLSKNSALSAIDTDHDLTHSAPQPPVSYSQANSRQGYPEPANQQVGSHLVAPTSSAQNYKKPITYGIAGAIIILVISLIAYLLQ